MIELKNISKSFGEIKALDKVSFKLPSEGVIGLLGPNGAGKTTLMRILVGYLQPDQGKILWEGKRVNPNSIKHKSRLGYLPENNPLYDNMTIKEYLSFIASIRNAAEEQINKVVRECGLKNVIQQKIEILSRGYKQRVGLAAALLGKPKLLILDEPTSGLDPNQIIEIRQLIKRLAVKKLIILSTHILPEAREICQRILIISQGRIVLDADPKSIKDLEKKFVELTG
ncbi:MAG TPA: ATP-binding cassette domain-containing protein [Candidatus Woesebacteria bacterium]|nr:ATP-binding cassette domain-containing protein [Candidatus Woesebacteria bacterium]HRS22744.1 ATP-binding cassette domain-containing protein [Candidatus Woesebacteria bacterium]HRT40372.1 ATP-binding cassette domain-containing protein [Candidatus Woesebacteria bacterium]